MRRDANAGRASSRICCTALLGRARGTCLQKTARTEDGRTMAVADGRTSDATARNLPVSPPAIPRANRAAADVPALAYRQEEPSNATTPVRGAGAVRGANR